MFEILDKGYIDKKEKGSGEYQELYLEGIEFLQKLSGANWTDYNAHDPGVTILENIAYTLTNLSYKVDLPIIDILTEAKGSVLNSGDNGFFEPSDILTTNPVIIEDYRKMFIDGINNVKNVWIKTYSEEQLNNTSKGDILNLRGLYHVYIEMFSYDDNNNEQYEEEHKIKKRVNELFHSQRNLCEDMYEVTILAPCFLEMDLKVTLDEEEDGELIFAQIYYDINDYLSHDTKFDSIWDLRKQKENTNSIYEGPVLSNGFMKDDELSSKRRKILLTEIAKIISRVHGVLRIDHFEMYPLGNSENAFKNEILVPRDKVLRLSIPEKNTTLCFKTANIELLPNMRAVKKKFISILSEHHGRFTAASTAMNIERIPKGEALGVSSYYSIREQFPAIYGVGHFGLPKDSTAERKAQVKQLKGFLLPLDQLMSDFLAQLTNLYALYDVDQAGLQSYFYQELEDMPKLVSLIKSNSTTNDKKLEEWKATLNTLNGQHDSNAIRRLNEVADNLLARHAEQYPSYVLQKINTCCFGKKFTDQSYHKKLLSWKRKLISNYGRLSYNRAKSFNYKLSERRSTSSAGHWVTPVIIEKIALLLGIQHPEPRELVSIVDKDQFNSKALEETGTSGNGHEGLVSILRDEIVFKDQNEVNLEETLRLGVLSENYEANKLYKSEDRYNLILKIKHQEFELHAEAPKKTIDAAKDYSIQFLKTMNEKSEGIHLLEHLLLAPPVQGKYFGFSFSLFPSKEQEIIFEPIELLTNRDRNKIIYVLNNLEIKYRVKEAQARYYIEIYDEESVLLARSRWSLSRLSEVYTYIDAFENLKTTKDSSRLQKLNYYAHYGSHKVNESFFSFKMSFILPSWPVRFQLESFKKQFSNILYEHTPIHIQYKSYWLGLEKMRAFEKVYFEWLDLLSNEKEFEAKMLVAYKLIQKIKQYKNETPK